MRFAELVRAAHVLVVLVPYPHQQIIDVLAWFELRPKLLPTRAALGVDVGLLYVENGELKISSRCCHTAYPK